MEWSYEYACSWPLTRLSNTELSRISHILYVILHLPSDNRKFNFIYSSANSVRTWIARVDSFSPMRTSHANASDGSALIAARCLKTPSLNCFESNFTQRCTVQTDCSDRSNATVCHTCWTTSSSWRNLLILQTCTGFVNKTYKKNKNKAQFQNLKSRQKQCLAQPDYHLILLFIIIL